MDWMHWEPPPVGVRVFLVGGVASPAKLAGVQVYQGVSYCDAVRQAGKGEILQVLPSSIQVCQWSPVVLGLKEPQGRFEENLAPRLDYPVAGLLLAPLDRFPGEPDVVVVRAQPEVLQGLVSQAGPERLWRGHGGQLDRSALPLFQHGHRTARHRLVNVVNALLAALAHSAQWRTMTCRAFRSSTISATWEAIISRTMADMSVCRNSTVIPLLTDRVNASLFCSGGITWGGNRPQHMTSGWPWAAFGPVAKPSRSASGPDRGEETHG